MEPALKSRNSGFDLFACRDLLPFPTGKLFNNCSLLLTVNQAGKSLLLDFIYLIRLRRKDKPRVESDQVFGMILNYDFFVLNHWFSVPL